MRGFFICLTGMIYWRDLSARLTSAPIFLCLPRHLSLRRNALAKSAQHEQLRVVL